MINVSGENREGGLEETSEGSEDDIMEAGRVEWMGENWWGREGGSYPFVS